MKNHGLAKLFTGYFILSLISHPVLTIASEVAADDSEKIEAVETSATTISSSEQVPTEESSQAVEPPADSGIESSSALVETPAPLESQTEESVAPKEQTKKTQQSGISATTSETGIALDSTNFPDPEFRNWVINWLGNGYSEGDIIDFDGNIPTQARIESSGIKDLTGIEHFVNLKELSIKISSFKDLNVSQLLNLEKLTVDKETNLSSVTFGEQHVLKNISIMNSNLSNIDVSSLSHLEKLNLMGSSILSEVTLGQKDYLTELSLTGTIIKRLDAGASPNLKQLELEGVASLAKLSLESNTKIERLILSGTSLVELNVANATNLTHLDVSNTKITDLDVQATTKLTYLNVSKTPLKELDVTSTVSLIELNASETPVAVLDLTQNTNLTKLVVNNTKISELDLVKNGNLIEVQGGNSALTSVNVADLGSLKTLKLAGNPKLATVTLKGNTALEVVDLSKAMVEKISLKQEITPNLKELIYKDSGVHSVSITGLAQLTLISMNGSKELTSVMIDGAPLLKDIFLETANELNNITLDDVPALESLRITNHQLKKIDLASAPNLKVLNLRAGFLETLDLSVNENLTDVNLNDNKLSYLNTEKNVNLVNFQAEKQVPAMVVEWKNNAWEISFAENVAKEDYKNITLNTDNLSNRLVWDVDNGIARFNGFGDGAPTALVYTYQTSYPTEALVSVNAKLTPKEQFGKIIVNYLDQNGKKIASIEPDEFIGKVGTELDLNKNKKSPAGYTYVKYEYIAPAVLLLRTLPYSAAVTPTISYKQGVGTVNLTYQANDAPPPGVEKEEEVGPGAVRSGGSSGSGISTKRTNSGSSKLGSGSSSLPKTGELVAESVMWLGTSILGLMVLIMRKKSISERL